MLDILELVDPAELIGVVRALQFPQFVLGGILPRQTVEDVLYSLIRANADTTAAAPVRSFDTEAPIGRRPGISRTTGALPPISQKIALGESDRLMVRALLGQGTAEQQRLIDAIFDDAARMVRSVEARLEIARGDALVDGIVTINENGVQFTVDYGVPSGTKVSAAAAWSTVTTDMLGDLMTWLQAYIDLNGAPPARIVTSSQVMGYMLRNDSIRNALGASAATMVTRQSLTDLLAAFGVPPIETYDAQLTNSAGTKARVIPADRVLFLPPNGELGRTQYGITAEAVELAGEGLIGPADAAGVVATVFKDKDPVAVWTKGAAIALPIIANPDLLFVADVF
jgi:hypothetical protein